MHTAEHILNQTMVRMFGCERSKNSHIERKKSKCDYFLSRQPDDDTVKAIEKAVNTVIVGDLPVTEEYMPWMRRQKLWIYLNYRTMCRKHYESSASAIMIYVLALESMWSILPK